MAPQKKIMVVDDERIVCERLKPALEKLGLYVETWESGQMALDRLAVEPFDVIVTDLKMPKPDGMDVLSYVKKHCPQTRVIIITGYPTIPLARECLTAGVVDFITKPFKIGQLRDLVAKVSGDDEA